MAYEYTVQEYMLKHGKSVLDGAAALGPDGETIIAMCVSGAFDTYGYDEEAEDELTEKQKEMVALTALYELLSTESCKTSIEGAIARVRIGSDGSPDISFYDRMKTNQSYRDRIVSLLSVLQRTNGFSPYLAPTISDVPFTADSLLYQEEDTDSGETEGTVG